MALGIDHCVSFRSYVILSEICFGRLMVVYLFCLHTQASLSEFCVHIGQSPGGGGVHNMLRVRLCAAHIGGF